MPPRKHDSDDNYVSVDTHHYNVCFKSGALLNRVTQRIICGLSPKDIDWIWNVEEERRATPEEIRTLCKPVKVH
jgi:hypothetical protein